MSYDVHLEADLGNGPVTVGNLDANCTYNVSGMFKAACGSTPSAWDKMPAVEVAELCAKVVEVLETERGKYDAMNPANGWGNRECAVDFAHQILTACRAAPNATLRVY